MIDALNVIDINWLNFYTQLKNNYVLKFVVHMNNITQFKLV
jgi:hypothetical protein